MRRTDNRWTRQTVLFLIFTTVLLLFITGSSEAAPQAIDKYHIFDSEMQCLTCHDFDRGEICARCHTRDHYLDLKPHDMTNPAWLDCWNGGHDRSWLHQHQPQDDYCRFLFHEPSPFKVICSDDSLHISVLLWVAVSCTSQRRLQPSFPGWCLADGVYGRLSTLSCPC